MEKKTTEILHLQQEFTDFNQIIFRVSNGANFYRRQAY